MGSKIPIEEGGPEARNKWKWQIRIDRLTMVKDALGIPTIVSYVQLPYWIEVTTGCREQEFELIDKLTTNKGAFGAPSDSLLYKTLKNERDGLYRLVVYKQTNSARLQNKKIYGFWSYCLVSKHKDIILFETRYFQCGALNPKNLETRDPLEDTRRKNIKDIPSGGVDRAW